MMTGKRIVAIEEFGQNLMDIPQAFHILRRLRRSGCQIIRRINIEILDHGARNIGEAMVPFVRKSAWLKIDHCHHAARRMEFKLAIDTGQQSGVQLIE